MLYTDIEFPVSLFSLFPNLIFFLLILASVIQFFTKIITFSVSIISICGIIILIHLVKQLYVLKI